jgi:HAD superfamily hydrolase (TIGR01509 family)
MDVGQVYATFLGRSFGSVAAHWQSARGEPIPESFAADYAERLHAAFTASLRPIVGIEALLDRLAVPFCLASSSNDARIAHSLATAGLASRFEGRIFSAAMVPNAKPAPDLFLHAAARMGAAPVRCLVVEDSVNGVLAGKAAGMTVWGFVGGSHCVGRDVGAALTAAGADRVFAAMRDFGLE